MAGQRARDRAGLRQARVLHAEDGASAWGSQSHHERCLTCPEKDKCTFYLDIGADKNFKELYLDNEKHDGYFRDRCVFRPDINIEDTMNVIVKYKTGATLSYSLNAFNAWEGYTIAFNGTKGRIEHRIVEGGAVSAGATNYQGDGERSRAHARDPAARQGRRTIELWTGDGGHGGGDNVMLTEVFGTAEPDKYKRAADERSGLYSCLIGASANKSFVTRRRGEDRRPGDRPDLARWSRRCRRAMTRCRCPMKA